MAKNFKWFNASFLEFRSVTHLGIYQIFSILVKDQNDKTFKQKTSNECTVLDTYSFNHLSWPSKCIECIPMDSNLLECVVMTFIWLYDGLTSCLLLTADTGLGKH
jgi:hypothetical protein